MNNISAMSAKVLAFTRRPGRSIEEKLAVAVFTLGIALFSAQAAFAHDYKLGALEIDHPWTRATPGGAKVGGGYLVVKNTGDTPDRLISATSPAAGKVEIHEMAIKDGVMIMRPLKDGLEIPAHGEVALKPGGYHIMLMDLKGPIVMDQPVSATLVFEKAGKVDVVFKVAPVGAKSLPEDGMKGHSGMSMDGMQGHSGMQGH